MDVLVGWIIWIGTIGWHEMDESITGIISIKIILTFTCSLMKILSLLSTTSFDLSKRLFWISVPRLNFFLEIRPGQEMWIVVFWVWIASVGVHESNPFGTCIIIVHALINIIVASLNK